MLGMGCGASDTASPIEGVTGSYHLVAVNRSALPVTVVLGGVSRSVTSGTLTVSDTSYAYAVCVNASGSQVQNPCGAGHLTVSGEGLVWSSDAGVSFVAPGTFSSRGLVVSGDSLTFRVDEPETPNFTFVR